MIDDDQHDHRLSLSAESYGKNVKGAKNTKQMLFLKVAKTGRIANPGKYQ